MELAAAENAPVVVADRIQCYVDLSVTSARFTDAGEPHRYHLSDRVVQQGDYPVDEAAHALAQRIHALSRHHRYVVVEGGSISLLRRFAAYRGRFPARFTAQVLHVRDGSAYLNRLRTRARRMLRTGMVGEFAKAWRHTEQRDFVASINGPEALVQWCHDNATHPDDMVDFRPESPEIAELAEQVAQVHAEHGHEQDEVFTRLFC